MEDTDAYKDKLEKLKASIMAVITDAKLPVRSAGLVIDWDLPTEAADKMPQGVIACGDIGLTISGLMALIMQTSRFSLALTEKAVQSAIAKQPTEEQPKSEQET